jgi:predicted dinucleotide-binding enzyme
VSIQEDTTLSVSIIGAGAVGQALAQVLLRAGEGVVFGVPDPGKYRKPVGRPSNHGRPHDAAEEATEKGAPPSSQTFPLQEAV